MSHVSIANNSYPYRGTLLRLDANGDGLLSRQELAADQRPGLMAQSAEEQSSSAADTTTNNGALVSLMAKLLQLPGDGRTDVRATTSQSGVSATTDADVETQTSMDLYRGTYGQYALDDMAA